MKFQFKIQSYQTDAVNSVVNIFSGQPFAERISYVRDLGIVQKPSQLTLFDSSMDDVVSVGFENARVVLTDEKLLLNIHNMQALNNIRQSDSLVKHLGRCSLDVELQLSL